LENNAIVDSGLRGVTVASTRISDVDGDTGKLIYRGFLARDLAKSATFEETAYLLLFERLPNETELNEFKKQLCVYRRIPDELIKIFELFPKDAKAMDVLQAATALLGTYDPDINGVSREDFLKMGLRLVARMPTVVASWHRIRSGMEPIEPDSNLDHGANFLYMLKGEMPEADVGRFFDVAMLLHAEHSFNASTFSARQVASTRAHMYASVSAAVGSLSGELHGGANVRVMEMLLEIGSVDAVEAYVTKILNEGKRIMGLGHAVYKVDDPRAHILAPMAMEMGKRAGQPNWYEISKVLEKKGKAAFKTLKNSDIYVNVDFYSASLYYAMGIPVDLFTPVFSMARAAGWVAHVIEERFAGAAGKPMLYRPESQYVGNYCGPDECPYIPINNR
jgi:citrate synthase